MPEAAALVRPGGPMLPMWDGTGNWDAKSLWPWCFTSVAFGSASLRVRLRRDAPGLDPGLQVRRPAIPFLPVGKAFSPEPDGP